MPVININTSSRTELIDITSRVTELIPPGFRSGICVMASAHTTAGITINEAADPDVAGDIARTLDKLVPWRDSSYRHGEGNSAAHVKTSIVGMSQTIPVENGRLCLGTWQGIYFCEFDGPRRRTVNISFVAGYDI